MATVPFHSISEGIWEHSHDIRFCGILLPHRMTVIRMLGEKLLLHSPTRCDEATVDALSQMGTVTEIIAPNGFHDLFLAEWLLAVPEARLWIPPGMDRYFPRMSGRVCEISQDTPWGEVDCAPLKGVPRLNEYAFYHAASHALIVADLLFNIEENARFATRVVARVGGFYQRLAMPRDIRWWYVRDRDALKQSVQRIMSFPFEKIIVGHGANILSDGRRKFREAFQWLFDDGP
ncbi:MAG TPA: DUF4336 domain-containing protein [Verrucomicrobiales bacterium]|nr:DUF4336 domain-containing protein [Verrucomicrobiales bacterium]